MAAKYHIIPLVPTAAGDRTVQPLIGTDLWPVHQIDNLHIIPTLLDIPKFTYAVRQALSLFPALAGRVRHDKNLGTWWVDLTNSPIPFILDTTCDTPAPSPEWVILPTTSPFIEPIDSIGVVNQDLPLLSIKLSLLPASNQSIIGTCVSHLVSDGHQILDFTRTISDFYQGVKPSIRPYNVPAALPPLDDPRDATNENDWFNRQQLDYETAGKLYSQDQETSTQVDLHVRPEQSEALKRIATSALVGSGSDVGFVSTQDALSAYLIYVLNQVLPSEERIETIMNVANYREALVKVNPSLVSVCGALFVPAALPTLGPAAELPSILASIATAIRSSLELFKDPAYIAREVARASEAITKHVNEGKTYMIIPEKGIATINSNARYEWTSPHFGHPGRVQFHTSLTVSRYARVFRSNPIVAGLEDGQKVVDSREGWVDVQFRVPNALAEGFVTTFEKGLEEIVKAH